MIRPYVSWPEGSTCMTGGARARESQNNYKVCYCKSSDVAYKEVLNNKAKLYNFVH